MKILIPTDAGLLGDYAFSVVEKLATRIDVELYYLSIIPGPADMVLDVEGSFVDDHDADYSMFYEMKKKQHEKILEWSRSKHIEGKVEVRIGDVNSSILSYAKEVNADLIIMGTQGVFSLKDTIHGSHTEYITSHAKIPVISLKCERSAMQMNEVVFLSDFENTEAIDMSIVKAIAAAFYAKIVLLKIVHKESLVKDISIFQKMDTFAKNNHLTDYRNEIYYDTTVAKGVSRFCEEENIDLVSIGTHQHHGIWHLFHKSVSKDLVNHIYHPVLTFPI